MSCLALALTASPALAAPPESPETLPPEAGVGASTVLRGVIDPEGVAFPVAAGNYQFLYNVGSGCEGGVALPEPPGAYKGLGPEPVSQLVTGLAPASEYTVCLQARNVAEETSVGPAVHFRTPEAPETLKAESVTATTAQLTGVLNPNNKGEAGSYEFLYRASSTECVGGAATGSTPTSGAQEAVPPVEVSGLLPGTDYTFCLLVRSETGGTALGSPQTFRTLAIAPTVAEPLITEVASTSATLHATVSPNAADARYRFVYAPLAESLTSEHVQSAPAGGGDAGEGGVAVPVSVHVTGLLPATVYHFRVIAENEVTQKTGKLVEGEEATFTTQTPGGELVLPDGRQYEMVTPPNKHGALFFGLNDGFSSLANSFVAQASAAGSAVVDLASQPPEAQPEGNTSEISVLATRGPTGWSSQAIAPPHAEGTGVSIGSGAEYRLFSEDLSRGVVQQLGNFAPLSADASESTPYLRDDYLNGNVMEHCQSSCFQALVTRADTTQGTVFGEAVGGKCLIPICGPEFLAGTADLRHAIVRTPVQLTSTANETSEFGLRLYEWSGGELQPLYLLPTSEGAVGVSAGEPSGLNERELADHQLSEDGSVFFTYHGHLYLHDFAKGESVRLDGTEPGEGEAAFLYASSDGATVLFTDPRQLTNAAGGGVYECRLKQLTCELELTGLPVRPYLVENENLAAGSLIGGSKDASYMYFIGAGERLDVAHFGNGQWTTTEGPIIAQSRTSGFLASIVGGFGEPMPTYRISPNGRFVAFMSDRRLTTYDNRDVVSGQPDEEVYLYDATSNRLVCASCNPTAARPVGVQSAQLQLVAGEFAGQSPWVAANVPPWTRSRGKEPNSELYQPRYLSDSGRLFFDSHDALVPQDVNGTQDVYEYESVGVPAGEHACSEQSATFSARSGGCVSLISSGASPEESAFLDASESGADVFFLTQAKLAPQDKDTALDIYDAHECTSASPCIPPSSQPTPPCNTETSCKASQTPQPDIFGTPASGTFSGPGNLKPEPPAPPKPKTAAQIKAEKLAKALKVCRRDKSKKKRASCEKQARKKYGAAKKAKKAKKARKSSRAKNATDKRRTS